MGDLGKIESIELRTQWPDEAVNFTPWLASPEGVEHLNNALQMDLEITDTEVAVGSYRADIVAEDSGSSQKVVIENQLDPTNHDHIGKLITYAAGIEATTVVWVAKAIREEHRKAIEWLNDNTSSDIEFYALQIELWKIGNSLPAPRLTVVAQPNIQVRAIRSRATSETKNMYYEFWDSFLEYMMTVGEPFGRRKPSYSNWYSISIGRSGVYINLTLRKKKGDIGCELELRILEKQQLFDELYKNKDEIETIIGSELEWLEMKDKMSSRIINRAYIDINEKNKWQDANKWFIEQTKLFKEAFQDRIISFEPDIINDDIND